MKFSLLSLALLPAAYGAPGQPDAEQNEKIMQAIGKMTNDLLLDTEKFALMNGMLLEEMVTVPGVTLKSSNEKRMEKRMEMRVEKRAWTDYLPLVKSLTKNVLSGVGGVLAVTGFGEVAKIILIVGGLL